MDETLIHSKLATMAFPDFEQVQSVSQSVKVDETFIDSKVATMAFPDFEQVQSVSQGRRNLDSLQAGNHGLP